MNAPHAKISKLLACSFGIFAGLPLILDIDCDRMRGNYSKSVAHHGDCLFCLAYKRVFELTRAVKAVDWNRPFKRGNKVEKAEADAFDRSNTNQSLSAQ